MGAALDDSGRQATAQVDLPPGTPVVELELDFTAGYPLAGRVFLGDRPVGGVEVRLVASGSGLARVQTTDPTGGFRLEGLEVGPHKLFAEHSSMGGHYEGTVEIPADFQLEIQLLRGSPEGR